MSSIIKIVLIIVVLMLWVMLNGIIVNSTERVGIPGLITGFVAIAAMRGIWKYKPENDDTDTKLDKN